MDIRELCIGDWVYHDDLVFGREIAKVHRLNKDKNGETIGITVYRSDGAFGVVGYILTSPIDNDINPIPLTPEILEKNRFEFKHKGIEFDHYETSLENGKTLLLSFDRGEHYYLMYEEKGERGLHQIDCPLGYVHQLQHALRLANIEKEITL